MEGTRKRSLVKSIVWRIICIVVAIFTTFFLTGRWDLAVALGTLYNAITMILYYFHERIWNRIKWGMRKSGWSALWAFLREYVFSRLINLISKWGSTKHRNLRSVLSFMAPSLAADWLWSLHHRHRHPVWCAWLPQAFFCWQGRGIARKSIYSIVFMICSHVLFVSVTFFNLFESIQIGNR